MNALWRSLTLRGRVFVGVGAALLVAGVSLTERDILRVALLVLAVPAIAAASVLRSRPAVEVERSVTPERTWPATPTTVHLRLANRGSYVSRLLLAEEELPLALGSRPRFAVDRLAPGEDVLVRYQVTPAVRGSYRLGPLRIGLTDPLGMCQTTHMAPDHDQLLVLPTLYPLQALTGAGMMPGGGDSEQMKAASEGHYDVSTREYRQGDDLRRVHWRSTARVGELMVRREERSQELQASVVLDTRLVGHRGEAARSSLEWAISAAGSACEHLADAGFDVRLLLDRSDPGWNAVDDSVARDRLLDRLAMLTAGSDHALHDAIEVVSGHTESQIVIAVLGEVDAALVTPLARQSRGVALLMRSADWAELPAPRAEQLSAATTAAAALLSRAGWAVATYGRNDSVPDAWASAIAALGLSAGRR